MKNKLFKRLVNMVASLAIVALSASSAFAVTNSSSVISPYWQLDDDTYTFVAVSHPSLSGINSEVGVVLTALTDDGTTNYGTAAFTVSQNATTRIFIVATNHSSINSTDVTGTDTIFVTGTTNASQGSLVFTPRSSNPLDNREGTVARKKGMTDITALSYWGAVVVTSKTSGFAMEFIGDTHDSAFNVITTTADASIRKLAAVGLN